MPNGMTGPLRTFDLPGVVQRAEQVKASRLTNRVNELRLEGFKRKALKEEAKAGIFQRATSPTGEFDPQAAQRGLFQAGQPQEAFDLRKVQTAQQQAEATLANTIGTGEGLDLENAVKRNDILGRGALGVTQAYMNLINQGVDPIEAAQKTQPLYNQVLQGIQGQGVEIEGIPQQFDPNLTLATTLSSKSAADTFNQLKTSGLAERKFAAKQVGGGGKAAQNFRLPTGEIVLSRDGGKTFTDNTGVTKPLPFGTIKVPGGASLAEVTSSEQKKQAKDELKSIVKKTGTLTENANRAAKKGTGPYAKLKAGIDAVVGGLGLDKAFGKNGLFPETTASRQQLRLIKQTGKSALLNSARGATWEQEKIDQLFPDPSTFWANPTTEVGKFSLMRDTLNLEKNFNLKAIETASPKEIVGLRKSNREIDSVLNLIGKENAPDPQATEGDVTTVTMPDGSTQTFDATGKRLQ